MRISRQRAILVAAAANDEASTWGPSGDLGAGAASGSQAPAPAARETAGTAADLARCYYTMQHPALANTRYSKALEDFTQSAVLAYECGHAEGDLDEQLGRLPPEDLSRMKDFNPAECLAMVCLVWVTLTLAPRTVRRWATGSAVSDATLARWRGFVGMIVTGYFEQRMAWFPLERLTLELSAVQDLALPPELVAERARVVFTVLEHVYPQFAKD